MNCVEANQGAEHTGKSGSLPDAEYDIHCKNYHGPEYKLNYLSSSCEERLKAETCDCFDCPRFVGKVRNVKKYHFKPGSKIGRPKTTKKERPCVFCGSVGKIQGRELCYACYKNHRRYGTLEDFPTSTELRRREKLKSKS